MASKTEHADVLVPYMNDVNGLVSLASYESIGKNHLDCTHASSQKVRMNVALNRLQESLATLWCGVEWL